MAGRLPLGSAVRLLALAGGLGVAATALAARAFTVARVASTPAARVEDWVELTVVGGAALAAAWVALGALLGLTVVLAARAGARWRAGEAAVRALAPAGIHRLVRAGVGATVGAGLVLTPATAMAADHSPAAGTTIAWSASDQPADAAVDLSWHRTPPAPDDAPVTAATIEVADAATRAGTDTVTQADAPGTPEPAAEPAPEPTPEPTATSDASAAPVAHRVAAPQADGSVVVLRGDTLWDVAAHWLGGSPSDAEIMAATVAWHEANRAVIGDDPDVILPGQVLVPPS